MLHIAIDVRIREISHGDRVLRETEEGTNGMAVSFLYYLGNVEERPRESCEVPAGFEVHGVRLKEKSVLFSMDKKKEIKRVKRVAYSTDPTVFVYIYHFDPPTDSDMGFLAHFDLVEQAKMKLFTLYRLSNGRWTASDQLRCHPISSRADWLRDKFTVQYLIISIASTDAIKLKDWFLYAESIYIKNCVSSIKTVDDRILTMKMNGEEDRAFDAEYLSKRHVERLKSAIESVDQSTVDELLKQSYDLVWSDRMELQRQIEINNVSGGDWLKTDHNMKKVLPSFVRPPAALDSNDKRLFDTDYMFGLEG